MNLVEALLKNSLKTNNSPLFVIDNKTYSSREFWNCVGGVQKQLSALGVTAYSTVGICSDRGINFFVDLFALLATGATVSILDNSMTEADLDHALSLAPIEFSLGMQTIRAKELNVDYSKTDSEPSILDLPGDRVAMILFTSGSTGIPKGVPLTHQRLLANVVGTLEKHFINKNDRLAINIPFRFVSAISHMLSVLMTGSCLVGSEKKMMPRDFLSFLKSSKCTAFGGAPIQIRIILEAMKYDPEFCSTMKWVMSSGDHLPPEVITALFEVNPEIKIVSAYGLTELAGRFFMNPLDKNTPQQETLGTPIRGLSFDVVNENFVSLEPGEAGEVVVEGELIFDGYLNNEAANQKAFHNGRFRTGDLGYKTPQGQLILTGRCSDVFKVSGLKVATQKLCSSLMDSGLFEDVAIFPYVDNNLGTVPYLLYVSKEDRSLNDVIGELREKLPAHYMPRKMKRVHEIPRTGSGKIRRKELYLLAEI